MSKKNHHSLWNKFLSSNNYNFKIPYNEKQAIDLYFTKNNYSIEDIEDFKTEAATSCLKTVDGILTSRYNELIKLWKQ